MCSQGTVRDLQTLSAGIMHAVRARYCDVSTFMNDNSQDKQCWSNCNITHLNAIIY